MNADEMRAGVGEAHAGRVAGRYLGGGAAGRVRGGNNLGMTRAGEAAARPQNPPQIRVWRGQAPHKWLVEQQRIGRRAWIMAFSEIVSHHERLEGVYATASAPSDSAEGRRSGEWSEAILTKTVPRSNLRTPQAESTPRPPLVLTKTGSYVAPESNKGPLHT